MKDEFREKNLKEWDQLLHALFNGHIPNTRIWSKKETIIDILKFIAKYKNTNHTLFPNGGGMDLLDAEASIEHDCIELRFYESSAHVIRPNLLSFQSFGEPYEWAYFRIETDNLAPSGVYENLQGIIEQLTEISPGEYVDRYCWDEGYYGHDENGDKIRLPRNARVISRIFSGVFVIFSKGSIYNSIIDTYDGLHSKMNAEEFKQYIGNIVRSLKEQAQ